VAQVAALRVPGGRLLATLAVVGGLLASGSAMAQVPGHAVGQPRQLFPQDSGSRMPAPQQRMDDFRAPLLREEEPRGRIDPSVPDALEPNQRESGTRALRGGIVVDELEGSLPESSGILESGEGGLGLDLWHGSDRDTLIHLIRVVPDNLESPSLRNLARRLLLSTATPPSRGAGSEPAGELLRARAARLHALGAHEELLELLRRLPREAREDPLLARLQVESALLTRERAEACRLAAAGIDDFANDAFWQEALIYCQISEGREDAANLGLSLLREAGEGDPQVLQLAEAALGYREDVEPRKASALVLAYLDALDEPPPSGLIEQAPYAFLGVLARQLTLPAEERLPLTERAVQFGLLQPRALAEAYERYRFEAQQLDHPASEAQALEGAEARALLYKGAWRATSADKKLELLQAFVEECAAEDLTLAALLVSGDLVLDVHPDPALLSRAPLVVKSLLLTGRFEQAAAWMTLLRNAVEEDEGAHAAYVEVWPTARVAGIETDGLLNLNSWAAERADIGASGQLDAEKALIELVIDALEGRGVQQATPLLSKIGGAAPPSPSALFALQNAAAAGQRGEAALLVLQLLGSGAPGDDHPQALAESLTALADVGLRPDARAIAVESLLVQRN